MAYVNLLIYVELTNMKVYINNNKEFEELVMCPLFLPENFFSSIIQKILFLVITGKTRVYVCIHR